MEEFNLIMEAVMAMKMIVASLLAVMFVVVAYNVYIYNKISKMLDQRFCELSAEDRYLKSLIFDRPTYDSVRELIIGQNKYFAKYMENKSGDLAMDNK
jgi:hypothetical protein